LKECRAKIINKKSVLVVYQALVMRGGVHLPVPEAEAELLLLAEEADEETPVLSGGLMEELGLTLDELLGFTLDELQGLAELLCAMELEDTHDELADFEAEALELLEMLELQDAELDGRCDDELEITLDELTTELVELVP
jgi:hypothetical protein